MVKRLFGWSDKKYDEEYWGRNWRQWKRKQPKKKRTIEIIKEEEEVEQDKLGVREWTKEDDDKIGNIVDPYYEL